MLKRYGKCRLQVVGGTFCSRTVRVYRRLSRVQHGEGRNNKFEFGRYIRNKYSFRNTGRRACCLHLTLTRDQCRKIGMYVIMDPDYNNNFNIITKRDGSV
jgi:hypothetical protein